MDILDERADVLKTEGNFSYALKNYEAAIQKYSEVNMYHICLFNTTGSTNSINLEFHFTSSGN